MDSTHIVIIVLLVVVLTAVLLCCMSSKKKCNCGGMCKCGTKCDCGKDCPCNKKPTPTQMMNGMAPAMNSEYYIEYFDYPSSFGIQGPPLKTSLLNELAPTDNIVYLDNQDDLPLRVLKNPDDPAHAVGLIGSKFPGNSLTFFQGVN